MLVRFREIGTLESGETHGCYNSASPKINIWVYGVTVAPYPLDRMTYDIFEVGGIRSRTGRRRRHAGVSSDKVRFHP
jgi:hypothetical protein